MVSSSFFDPSLLLCARLALVPAVCLCAGSTATCQDDPEALVARIETWHGESAPPESLAISGTFTVTFEGVPAAGSELKGTFRQLFAGDELARTTADLGEHGSLESGCTPDLVWEVDPTTGGRVLTGAPAHAMRRWLAIARGTGPRELYSRIELQGDARIDDRRYARLVMTPAEGDPDTWYVDRETGRVARIDVVLPASEGAQLVWGSEPEVETQLVLEDWREVDGRKHAYRRAVTMGPATFTFVCTEIETGEPIDETRFTPPDSVPRGEDSTAPAHAAPGSYRVKARQAQPVASIRVRCKPADLSATLATIYPEIMAHLNAIGSRMTGPPFARYHEVTADEIDLEAGFPVARPIVEKGRIENGELPGGKLVEGWHVGPYERLSEAHEALRAHLRAEGFEARGGLWEVYWTDPGMVPDPAQWRTQLVAPIE